MFILVGEIISSNMSAGSKPFSFMICFAAAVWFKEKLID